MKKILAGVFVTIAVSGYCIIRSKPDGRLHINILDIGQGDAIHIRTPEGKNILVDGGPGKKVLQELSQTMPFWKRKIDIIISTHPDRDHLEGLLHVAQRHEVGRVYLTGALNNDELSRDFIRTLISQNIPFLIADANSDFTPEPGLRIDFLSPPNSGIRQMKNTNNTSLIFLLAYKERRMLFMGDAESPVENWLLHSGALNQALRNGEITILKVGHHGSKTSSSEEFLRTVSPEICTVSAGRNNRYGHPHAIVMEHLKRYCKSIRRTDTEGRIEFILSQ